VYWFLKRVLLGPLFWLLFRPKVEGREHLPREGAAILAANHLCSPDAFLVGLVAPRPVAFGAKAELFQWRGPAGKLLRWALLQLRQMPVDRSGGRAGLTFVAQAVAALEAGEVVGIFPEAGFSPDGRLYNAYTGVARIAFDAKASIVPIGLVYPTKWWQRTRVVVGEPLPPEAPLSEVSPVRYLTEAVTEQLALLTGQPRAYVRLRAPKRS
jgi:1-acyl-sn-glycerol-3-phosphate acyltransferase